MTTANFDPGYWPAAIRIEPTRLRRIAGLAVPLIAGAVATNIMTVVDTLMVGQLGAAALAGVGIAGQVFFLLLAAALGLAAGVQALVARRVGQGRIEETGRVLNAGCLAALLFGGALAAAGYLLVPVLFGWLHDDPLLVAQGIAYLEPRLPSICIIAINVAFRSYWVGVDLAKFSMLSIVSLSLANILFNYMLIFGNWGAPRLDVAGAGLGSTLAVMVGLLINIGFALRSARSNGFLRGLPGGEDWRSMLRISYPESLRQLLFTVGVLVMYVLVGMLGTQSLAAFHVIISICLIAYMPHIGLGGAATTVVGEALGRDDEADARLWGWQVGNVTMVLLLGLALLIVGFPAWVLSAFLIDADTLQLAVVPLQLAVLAHVFDGYSKVMGSAFIGLGDTQTAMRLTLLPQWLLLLPALALMAWSGMGLTAAMGAFVVVTGAAAIAAIWLWARRGSRRI
ncbi:MAG: MATE family efflux transporter, partial [Pseudomonadota bacterium]